MQHKRPHWAIALLMLAPAFLGAQSTAFRIRVLDGKTGKAIAGREVSVSGKAGRELAPVLASGKTDQDGVLSVNSQLPSWIVVDVHGRILCTRGSGDEGIHDLTKIVSLGVVQTNMCNLRMAVPPTPGELVVFVRRESLKELLDLD